MLSQKPEMIDGIVAWRGFAHRLTYVDKLNAKWHSGLPRAPKTGGDDTFHANSIMKLYEKLEGPKFMVVTGRHYLHRNLGMIGISDNRMFNVHRWFDYH